MPESELVRQLAATSSDKCAILTITHRNVDADAKELRFFHGAIDNLVSLRAIQTHGRTCPHDSFHAAFLSLGHSQHDTNKVHLQLFRIASPGSGLCERTQW
jgi:hypothetical protein